jgi:hypothetical protein
MTHLAPAVLVDAVEHSSLTAADRAHLESCPVCREEVAELTAMLAGTRRIEVPEPSPLFWERLSEHVREAVAIDASVRRQAPQWAEWPVLIPFAGLAVLVVALVAAVALRPAVDEDVIATIAAEGAADPAWALLSHLIGPLDVETAREAGIGSSPGAAEEAVLQLSAAEQEELVRLLRQELEQPGG